MLLIDQKKQTGPQNMKTKEKPMKPSNSTKKIQHQEYGTGQTLTNTNINQKYSN